MKSLLKQLHNVEEEAQGPSIDSEDMAERIECRRLRIIQRVENQRRLERGEHLLNINKKIDLSKSRKQMEQSRIRLDKLNEDGMEFLTNVKVANDARDNSRREEDEEMMRVRLEKIEIEAKNATDRFEEIIQRWKNAPLTEVPQQLNEMLQQQSAACKLVIEDKNKLITELQLECKEKDDTYVKELKKESDDIDIMVQRMNEQIDCMTKAYREELNSIETAFLSQRDDLIRVQTKEWNELLNTVKNKQVDYLEERAKRSEENDIKVNTLRSGHAEEYNALKIKLEKEVQTLEQNIQILKSRHLLNTEKLEYNFQVVKKRDEENTMTKAQQKRKVTRMQDILNSLRSKQAKLDKQCKLYNGQLTDDFNGRMNQFRELQRKSRTLLTADAKNFKEIWLMNEADLQGYAKKILEADRIISEQQLGIEWVSPNVDFLKNKGPVITAVEDQKDRSTSEIIREVLRKEESQNDAKSNVTNASSIILETVTHNSLTIHSLSPSTVRALLTLLCEEGSFLIEEKLKKLLTPLDDEEAHLIKMDAVFMALGIQNEADINRMLPYFIVQFSESRSSDDHDQNPVMLVCSEEIRKDVIHPTAVTHALHSFVADFYQDAAEMEKTLAAQQADDFQLDKVDSRDDNNDNEYWIKYANNLVDNDKELLWDALIKAQDKYLTVLVFRKKLLTDIDAYRTQNTELRFLLRQYLDSSINRDMKVAPSNVIKCD